MKTTPLGRTGIHLPILALGTWNIRDPAAMRETIWAAVDLGVYHIDTAELYPGAEEIVGEAIRGIRERVFLTTKVDPRHATYRGTLAACEGSLRRLKTSFIDLYLLHWLERDTPLEETLRAFQTLIEQGKIRFAGVSNFGVRELRRAQALPALQLGQQSSGIQPDPSPHRAGSPSLLPGGRDHRLRLLALLGGADPSAQPPLAGHRAHRRSVWTEPLSDRPELPGPTRRGDPDLQDGEHRAPSGEHRRPGVRLGSRRCRVDRSPLPGIKSEPEGSTFAQRIIALGGDRPCAMRWNIRASDR